MNMYGRYLKRVEVTKANDPCLDRLTRTCGPTVFMEPVSTNKDTECWHLWLKGKANRVHLPWHSDLLKREADFFSLPRSAGTFKTLGKYQRKRERSVQRSLPKTGTSSLIESGQSPSYWLMFLWMPLPVLRTLRKALGALGVLGKKRREPTRKIAETAVSVQNRMETKSRAHLTDENLTVLMRIGIEGTATEQLDSCLALKEFRATKQRHIPQ
uniref:Uncharacterized protein n=1 Tax=Branchiostoma floridae TaxID=7739 RepID=C3YSX0_BRAFL|eukprot:XP_002600622.1 hypothetical protein BRAFLDRAFT_95136 [Branchiostoma floridae]